MITQKRLVTIGSQELYMQTVIAKTSFDSFTAVQESSSPAILTEHQIL